MGSVTDRDDVIAAQFADKPSLREMARRGILSEGACEAMEKARAVGPPDWPTKGLVAALRAERERQGLSLAEVAERAGIDRAAIHKLEIGINRNPTATTLWRYADALGKRILWRMADADPDTPSAPCDDLSTTALTPKSG